MSNILNKKTLAFSLALVLLLTGMTFAEVRVIGTATYGVGDPDCEYQHGDNVGLWSADKQTRYDWDQIPGGVPRNYTLYRGDLSPGYYYLKFHTESTGYDCWIYVYLSSYNDIDHDMCALCNEL